MNDWTWLMLALLALSLSGLVFWLLAIWDRP